MLLLKVRTRQEAIGWAERYGEILGTGEIELGQGERAVGHPASCRGAGGPPLQILLIEKADQALRDRSAQR